MIEQYTICYLAANIEARVGQEIWSGVSAAAKDYQINLVSIPGGCLRDTRDYTEQRNILYDLIDNQNIDGVISWTSTLSNYIDSNEILHFHKKRFPGLPIIGIGMEIPGIPSIILDSAIGQYLLVEHLIESHGLKKIGFIQSIENHPYANNRFQGYLKALKDHGIQTDSSLISPPGDWTSDWGLEAMRILIEDRKLTPGKDIEAVACVNDNIAFGVEEYCKRNKIWIPGELALTGFNNINNGMFLDIPLTTLKIPFYEQGYKGVENLLQLIHKKEVPSRIELESQIVLRDSCGCFSHSINSVSTSLPETTRKQKEFLKWVYNEYPQIDPQDQDFIVFISMLEQGSCPKDRLKLLNQLRKVLCYRSLEKKSLSYWQTLITHIRHYNRPINPTLDKDHEIWAQLRILINETIHRNHIWKNNQQHHHQRVLTEIGEQLIMAYSFQELGELMETHLPLLEIHSFYLFLYEDYENPLGKSKLLIEKTLSEPLKIHSPAISVESRSLPSEVVMEKWLQQIELVVESLYFQDRQIGYILFQASPREGRVYRTLSRYISSSLHAIQLFEKIHHTQQELQTAYSQVEKKVEHRTRQLKQEIQERRKAENDLLKRAGQLTFLNATSSQIASDFKLEHVLETIPDKITEFFQYKNVGIYLYNEKEECFYLKAGNGFSLKSQPESLQLNKKEQEQIGNPMWLGDQDGILKIPILLGKELIGFIMLQLLENASREEQDILLMETLADQIGIAIKNRRHYERIQEGIIERKSLKEQLNQSQKMEAIGRLAGGIAHDFNNMLTAINGSAELLETTVQQDKEQLELLSIIQEAGNKASELIQQLLMFSRKQFIEPKVLDVNQIIGRLRKILTRLIGESIHLKTRLCSGHPRILMDQSQLEQIIMNLVINARDALPSGGQIIIKTKILKSQKDKEEKLQLVISDTGEGIDEALLDQIFEPFFTTKPLGKGTGLGLATVYGIIQQNQGAIKVKSTKGEGTSFFIQLPVKESLAAEEQEKSEKGLFLSGDETILYVEDEKTLRELAKKTLTKQGYTVFTAKNGLEALEWVQKKQIPINLLLTDVVMPEMGGAELSKKVKELYPSLKILYTSGYNREIINDHGLLTQGLHYLKKPYTPGKLLETIRDLLDS